MPPMISVLVMNRKAAAATAGLTFSRMVENIWRARVRWLGPATNKVSTTSSSDVAKGEHRARQDTGQRERQGHAEGGEWWLAAARSIRRLMPASDAVRDMTTKGTAITVWAQITPR